MSDSLQRTTTKDEQFDQDIKAGCYFPLTDWRPREQLKEIGFSPTKAYLPNIYHTSYKILDTGLGDIVYLRRENLLTYIILRKLCHLKMGGGRRVTKTRL